MAHVAPSTTSTATVRPEAGGSFVEWGAVFAGAVLASALSFVFLTFIAAIGLSTTSPWPNSGLSAKFVIGLAVFLALVQQIGSFMAGGYVAGRMRNRWQADAVHDAEFRDGLHGGLVWALGIVIGAALLVASGGIAARSGAEIAGKVASTAASKADPMDTVIDTMLRSTGATPAQPNAAAGAQRTTPQAGMNPADQRAEISRIMASSVASGSISAQDRTYLAQIVAQRTGVPQPEAEKRVNDAINSAREAADKARRAGVLAGFVTAAGLVISFGAAWWAALVGGQHRDQSVPARFPFGDRLRRPGAPRA